MSPNEYIHLFMLEKHKYVMDVWYNVKIAYVLFKLLISRRSPSFAPDSDVIFHVILFFNGNEDDTKKSNSAGASNRSFCSIFIKRFDHSETLLTKCRPKKALSAGWQGGRGGLVPSPQYHASLLNMLSKPLKCFIENKT